MSESMDFTFHLDFYSFMLSLSASGTYLKKIIIQSVMQLYTKDKCNKKDFGNGNL